MLHLVCFTVFAVLSAVRSSVVECGCEVHFEDQPVQFHYRGLEEFLIMGAEMFVMQHNFSRENYKEISAALVKSSTCTSVEVVGLDGNGAEVNVVNVRRKSISRGVIVEPRAHPALKLALQNICDKLLVPITLFHGNLNHVLAQELLVSVPCLDTLVDVGVDNLDSAGYNELLLSDDQFWSKVDVPEGDSIVVFQTDSGICGAGSAIREFGQFDYCGGLFHSYHTFHGGSLVGNGGFSVRNVQTARRLLRENPDHSHDFYWEDVLFSHWCLKDPDCSVCSEHVGAQFAATGAAQDSPSAWAFHRNWKIDFSPTSAMLCHLNENIRVLNSHV